MDNTDQVGLGQVGSEWVGTGDTTPPPTVTGNIIFGVNMQGGTSQLTGNING